MQHFVAACLLAVLMAELCLGHDVIPVYDYEYGNMGAGAPTRIYPAANWVTTAAPSAATQKPSPVVATTKESSKFSNKNTKWNDQVEQEEDREPTEQEDNLEIENTNIEPETPAIGELGNRNVAAGTEHRKLFRFRRTIATLRNSISRN